MSGSELLFEIGCEELPASYAMDAIAALPALVAKELGARGLVADAKQIHAAGTPRRLVVRVPGLPESTPKQKKTVTGPPKSAGFDKDGKPTKAAEGFAQKYGIPVGKITIAKTDKGEYLSAEVEEGGGDALKILAEALPAVIESIPFPKSMRWGALEQKFARPVRWILASLGGKLVPFKWAHLQSGLVTHGHRFLAPGPVEAKTWADYEKVLEKAHVVVDPAKRRERVKTLAAKAAAEHGGTIEVDEALLDTVSFLVEEPHPIVGGFDPALLELPREVIVTPMKHHQRYFPVIDAKGNLKAHFVTISNVPPRDPKVVARGNERVLRARLADAKFFFDLDQKTSLAAMGEGLGKLVFQTKLGTYREKVERLASLSAILLGMLEVMSVKDLPSIEVVQRAAWLSKADLVSKMVFEFPELQGLMGREYAARSGEKQEVADAIAEHYMPRGSGAALPASSAGALLSLADRFDSLVGIFGIGERPTGSADPYALRRHALAIIAILRARQWPLPIVTAFESAAIVLRAKIRDVPTNPVPPDAYAALDFLRDRLENVLREEGLPYDAIDAALSARFDDVNDAVARAKAIAELKKLPDLEPVATGFKRAANIIAKAAPADVGKGVDPSLFKHDSERTLHDVAGKVAEAVRGHARASRWAEALKETVKLRAPIDAFYAAIKVMDDDERLRRNRLGLLGEVVGIFSGIADFTKLVPAG